MRIAAHLVFDKMIGRGDLANIVIKRTDARQQGIGANRAASVFGKLSNGVRMLICSRGPQGKLAQYFYGMDFAPKDLRLGLVEASNEKIGNLVDQVLLYCYHYDPATGKYGAIVARVLKLSGLATVLGLGLMIFVLVRIGPMNQSKDKNSRRYV